MKRTPSTDIFANTGEDTSCTTKPPTGRQNMAESRRWSDKRGNPCKEEANASMKCLDENNYAKSRCIEYFEAYKECKKAWNAWRAERRKQGLPQYNNDYTK